MVCAIGRRQYGERHDHGQIRAARQPLFRAQAHDFSAQVSGSLLVVQKIPLQCRVDTVTGFALGFDVNDKPIGVQTPGQARPLSEQHGAVWRRPSRQTNHHAFARGGSARRIVVRGLRRNCAIDAFRDLPQGDFTQHRELFGLEEVFQRPLDLVGRVDLARFKAIDEILDRQIDVDHLIGPLQDRIGHGFAHEYAGRLLDHLIEAFEMLHVEGADDVDPGFEQFQHVLIALLVFAKRRVGMRQLIDDRHLGMALENRVEIHLLDNHAAIIDAPARHDLEPLDQRRGIDPVVRLDERQHHVDAALL